MRGLGALLQLQEAVAHFNLMSTPILIVLRGSPAFTCSSCSRSQPLKESEETFRLEKGMTRRDLLFLHGAGVTKVGDFFRFVTFSVISKREHLKFTCVLQ